MNNKNTLKIILSGLLTLIQVSFPSTTFAEEQQFAVLKPSLACEVVYPNTNSAPVYFSKDCRSAYVLPSNRMKMRIEEPIRLSGASDKICESLGRSELQIEKIDAIIFEHEKSIHELALRLQDAENEIERNKINARLEEIKKTIDYYSQKRANIFKEFDSMPALRASIYLSVDTADEINSFKLVNSKNIDTDQLKYPVRFVPAHITDSVLYVSAADALDYKGRSVLKVSFPGRVIEGGANNIYQIRTAMNGSISGIVDISSTLYCKSKSNNETLKKIFASAVAYNLGYKVRAQAGINIQVDAKISTIDFLRNMQNEVVRGKWNRGEFVHTMITGGLKNSLQVKLDDMGEVQSLSDLLNAGDEERPNLVAKLIGRVISDYLQNAQDKLESLQIIKRAENLRVNEVPPGSETVVSGYQTICHSSSSFFGLSRSRSCHNQPIYVTVDRNGVSKLIEENADQSFVENTVRFESNQTVHVPHESTFGLME